LRTKLFIPRARSEWVARPRLIRRLDEAAERALTLIAAPAGFGKTTLLAHWVAHSGREAAWLSLGAGDNDPAPFWSYVIAALQTVQADLGFSALGLLESPQPPPIQSVLTLLLNDLASLATPITLILDDYHMIETQAIHEGLAFLLDHLPPQVRLIITSRADPFLPVARLRARGQLSELRAADLRFTHDEAAAFLNEVMGLSLSAADVAALETHTEGWVAGLQLAALAMQAPLSMQGSHDLSGFIAAFTGSHRFILDYLTDEVLERRPKGTKNFLLQTSILNRLCGPLCDAITGQNRSQAILERLEHANFFLIPLDEERHWYRYHHLFADVLRNRLQQASASPTEGLVAPAELHRRASAWFEQAGLIDEAFWHALAAPDVERAAALVERNSLIMLQRSEILRIRAWLEQLPAKLIQTRPRLILAQGWVLTFTGQSQAAKAWLTIGQAATALNTPELPAGIRGELALLRATIARFRHEDNHELDFAQQALNYLPEQQRGLRASAIHLIGVARFRQGDTIAAGQAFAEAAALGQSTEGPYVALTALQDLASIQIRQGHLAQIKQTCQQAMRLAARWGGHTLPAAGMPYIDFGGVLYEQNELAEATQALTVGIELLRSSTEQYLLAEGYTLLARVQQAGGDPAGALATIGQCESWLNQLQLADFDAGAFLALGQARLWLGQDNLHEAIRWAQSCQWWPGDTHLGYHQAVTLVRLRLAQSRRESQAQFLLEAGEIINRLLAAAQAKAWWGHVIELSILQGLLCQSQGDAAGMLASLDQALDQALTLAEPEGYVRSFVDEGEPMATLLRQALSRGIRLDYVNKLLAAFNTGGPADKETEQESPLVSHPPAPLLIEPLTERELELLRLVAGGHSNQEIAQALFLAVGTVKKHLNNIFGKLGVSSRTQAVARARELDLL
jgi:LuxR family maltose regulon positive regulatory protein